MVNHPVPPAAAVEMRQQRCVRDHSDYVSVAFAAHQKDTLGQRSDEIAFEVAKPSPEVTATSPT